MGVRCSVLGARAETAVRRGRMATRGLPMANAASRTLPARLTTAGDRGDGIDRLREPCTARRLSKLVKILGLRTLVRDASSQSMALRCLLAASDK